MKPLLRLLNTLSAVLFVCSSRIYTGAIDWETCVTGALQPRVLQIQPEPLTLGKYPRISLGISLAHECMLGETTAMAQVSYISLALLYPINKRTHPSRNIRRREYQPDYRHGLTTLFYLVRIDHRSVQDVVLQEQAAVDTSHFISRLPVPISPSSPTPLPSLHPSLARTTLPPPRSTRLSVRSADMIVCLVVAMVSRLSVSFIYSA